jgi:uncharacterized repeat protein (TIGR03833 family)
MSFVITNNKYTSKNGYHYGYRNDGSIVRISGGGRSKNKLSKNNKMSKLLKVGSIVTINKKPYVPHNIETGIVAKILTKNIFHTRGRKVQLESGSIGRIYT